VRDERWFSGEEISILVAIPLSCANDGDDEEDEEDEEEEKKKGDEDEEEEEEPVWTALYQSTVCGDQFRSSVRSMWAWRPRACASGTGSRPGRPRRF
jgi:hypothetical protein